MLGGARNLAFAAIATATAAFASGCAAGVPLATPGAPGQPIPTLFAPGTLPSLPGPPTPPGALQPTPPGAPMLPTGPPPPDLTDPPVPPTLPYGNGPIGILAPWPAPPPTPEPTGYGPLVGRWLYEDEFTSRTIAFVPDGRYGASFSVGDSTPLTETGVYSADGSSLLLSPEGDQPVTYDMSVVGETFTLSGGNLTAPVEYTLEPGSRESVVAEQAEADHNEAELDALWRERLLVAQLTQQPPHVPVGEVPDDPNLSNIFVAPTVFVAPNLYLDITSVEISFTDGTTGEVQNSTNWYFQPTGRVYTVFTNWSPGRLYDRASPQPDVSAYWSAYTIEPGGESERVLIQTDAGEQIDTYLTHGRRNLVWGTSLYGQVDWENEQLNQGVR